MSSAIYQCLVASRGTFRKGSNIVQFLHHNQAINHDIIIVIINTDPLGDGAHWLLGCILFKSKTIVTLDSLLGPNQKIYQNLLTIACISHVIAGLHFNPNDWRLVFGTDRPTQKNGFDCGLFVCFYAHTIVKNIPFYQRESNEGRLWIKYLLTMAPRIISSERAETGRLICFNSEKINLTAIDRSIKNEPAFPVIFRSQEHPEKMNQCSDRVCLHIKEDRSDRMDLCISCRRWYHKFVIYPPIHLISSARAAIKRISNID